MKFQNTLDLCVVCMNLKSTFRVSFSPDIKRGRQTILHWGNLGDLFELKDTKIPMPMHKIQGRV